MRRRIALGWAAMIAASLAGGCTGLLGDFQIGEGAGDDAGRDSTGADDSAIGSDSGGDDAAASDDATTGSDATTGNDSGGDDAPGDTGSSGDTGGVTDAGSGDADAGSTCTGGQSCDAGVCQTASVVCTSGSPVCTASAPVTAGTSCGTSAVCDGKGNCVAVCTPANCASGCCDPTTHACVPYASQTGTSCGHAGAQCHSCAVGTSTPTCSTSNGTCAGTIIGQLGTYSAVGDLDTDGTYVYFIDSNNMQVGEVSAYSLGPATALSGSIAGLTSIAYDAPSNVVVFDAQASSTTTALYKATPGTASSAAKIATISGYPGSNSVAVSSLGTIDVTTVVSATTAAANNCTISGTCGALGSGIASSFVNGVTWPQNASEPFWADQTNGKIWTWVQSTSSFSSPATGLTSPAAPTNDGTYVYWLQAGGTLQIQRMPIAGGTVQTLGKYADNNQVQNLTTDGKYVYWSGVVGGVSGIYYMPVAGGTAQLLTTAPGGMPVRVHKESTTGQRVVYYGNTQDAAVDKVIAPP